MRQINLNHLILYLLLNAFLKANERFSWSKCVCSNLTVQKKFLFMHDCYFCQNTQHRHKNICNQMCTTSIMSTDKVK